MLDYKDLKTADEQARSPLENDPSLENAQRPLRRNALRRFCLGAVVGATLLAVALGAGLGVGLKKKSSNAHSSLASTLSSPNGSDRRVQVPPASNFVLRGQQALAQEPAMIRYYDFVLERRYGAPDGFNKTMLVVNGDSSRFPIKSLRHSGLNSHFRQACTPVRQSKSTRMTALWSTSPT